MAVAADVPGGGDLIELSIHGRNLLEQDPENTDKL